MFFIYLPVNVEDGKIIDEREVSGELIEFSFVDGAVLVHIVCFKHRLKKEIKFFTPVMHTAKYKSFTVILQSWAPSRVDLKRYSILYNESRK